MRTQSFSLVVFAATALAGCANFKPPQISYDDPPQPAVLEAGPPKPVEIVEIPKPLPLPGQLKPLPFQRSARRSASAKPSCTASSAVSRSPVTARANRAKRAKSAR